MAEESNFTPAQLEELQKYFRSLNGHFEIASGHKTVGHGKGEWCLTTDTAQGIHIYEQGNMKIGSNLTMEIITGHEGDPHTGNILIRCMNGDVHIEAPKGNLFLQGKNVQIEATDPKGCVKISSPRNIDLKAASIATNADNVEITSANSVNIIGSDVTLHGEISCDISEGPEQILDGTLIQRILGSIEEIKTFFKTIGG
jgi:hypothetical protein